AGIAIAMLDIIQPGRPASHGPGAGSMAFDPFFARLLGDHLGPQALSGRAQIALEPGYFLPCGALAFRVRRDLVVPVYADDMDHTVSRPAAPRRYQRNGPLPRRDWRDASALRRRYFAAAFGQMFVPLGAVPTSSKTVSPSLARA